MYSTHSHPCRFFMGIDVQLKRGCSYAVLNEHARMMDSGWVPGDPLKKAQLLYNIASQYSGVGIGIDAPRMPLQRLRRYYWEKTKQAWREKRPSEKGWGRHCEVIVKALYVGNPQWTPLASRCPEWMNLGFRIYEALSENPHVYEVFPSASYRMLQADRSLKITLDFGEFFPGPKDMLDACIAAATVYEFLGGRGTEVGGGDGLGTIVLPRKPLLRPDHPVFEWPS